MKKEFAITVLCVFSVLFAGCKKNVQKVTAESESVQTIVLSSFENSFYDTAYFKKPHMVVLETTEESFLSNITRMAMDDNFLFIYDKYVNKLFIFDKNGRYVNKIDCIGNGPKEYVQSCDFTIDSATKEIILLCAIPEKRMYFTYQGEYIKEEKNHQFFSNLVTDSRYIYLEDHSGNQNNQFCILDTKTGKSNQGFEIINIKNRYYANGNSLSKNQHILFGRRYDNSIYELKDGKIIEKYRMDFKKHSFPERFLTEERTDIIIKESSDNNYIFSMTNMIENDNYLMFYTNIGPFIYDKRNNTLTGYEQILTSSLQPVMEYPFSYYLPVENTNMIACPIDEPSFMRGMTKYLFKSSDQEKIKEMLNKYPGLEEIARIEDKIPADSNPVLFIYEFK